MLDIEILTHCFDYSFDLPYKCYMTPKIKWYEKFLLKFQKRRVSIDTESGPTCFLTYKRLFGKMFILKIDFLNVGEEDD